MGVASLDLQQTDAGQGQVDYSNIVNKPKINGVTLEGDLATEDLNIVIPKLVSELQNDAGYITKNVDDLVLYYNKTEVDNMISTIPKFSIRVVDELPTEDISSTTIYLLRVEGDDHFEEWVYIDNEWDKLGDGNIDLSDYATYEYVDAELAEKVDAADLATVALSGRYSDLIGAPTNLSQFTNDVGYLTEVPDGSVTRAKLSSALNADLTAVENAVDGLQNSVRSLSDTKADKTTVSALSDAVALKADKSELPTKTSDLTNDSGFITAADVPTNVSELTNDSGYITSAALTPYSTTQQMNTAISTAVANKADRSEIPTKVSDLTNDSGFVNATQVNTALAAYTYPSQDLYTQSDIDTMLAQISSLKIEVVNALPATGSADTIYLLKVRQQGNDIYQEYFWVDNAWELIGGIDLTDYYTKTEVNTLLTAKADVSAIPTKTSDLTNDSNFAVDANYVHTDNNYTTAEKNKLAGIAAGAEVNVQSNWTQTNSSADDFIKNKPSIPTKTSDLTNDSGFITSAAIPTNVSAFNNDAGYLDEIPDDSVGLNQLDSTIVNALNNINNKANTADLAAVAFSGDYDDLVDKPTIPTKTSDLTNDSGFVPNTDYASANTAGVIKVGNNLSIDANGVLSATGTTSLDWANITNKPTNVSYWTNDAGYITSADLPTKTSDLINDSNFVSDANYVHTDNNYTTAEKNKLAGIAAGAEVNQNAFSNVKVGSTTVAADAKTDTLELVAGSNVTITPDATNDKVTIAATDTTYSNATTSTAGLMSAADKSKLDGIASGAVSGSITKANGSTLGTTTIDSTTANYMEVTKLTEATDLNTLQTTGIYIVGASGNTNAPTTNWGTILVDWTGGTKYQMYIPDGDNTDIYKRKYASSTWGSWVLMDKVKYTAYNVSPASDTTAAWKTVLGGEGTYFTWYNTTNRFTNQPAQYGFLRTIIGGQDIRQDFWTQTGGTHYFRAGNGTGWYGTAGNAGAFKNINVNNGTLTIQKNGTNVQTFTANQSGNATANITVPTKVSELTSDVGGNSFYGTCATAAATAAKEVTVSSDQNFVLKTGVMVTFSLPASNTAQNPTINVNNTGAKQVKYNSTVITTSNLNRVGYSTRPTTFIYDGTYWVWVSWSVDDNTAYSTMSVNEGKTGTATSARTMRADYLKQIIDYHIRTADNLSPADDTTAKWKTALGSVNGSYYTWYSATGKFTNQPTQYGFLETFIQGGDIYQRWHTQSSGPILYRSGSSSGWSNPSDGTWNTVATTANIPTNLSDLYNDMGFASYSAGDHIDITNDVISAVDYVHSENPVAVTGSTPTVTSGMIADGAITASKLAAGVNLTLTLSTTDIGEGAALAANTLYGVYQ